MHDLRDPASVVSGVVGDLLKLVVAEAGEDLFHIARSNSCSAVSGALSFAWVIGIVLVFGWL